MLLLGFQNQNLMMPLIVIVITDMRIKFVICLLCVCMMCGALDMGGA
jgi:hypothetical protein